MDVADSRGSMPWRIRPLALVVVAVVVIALVILLVNVIGSPSTPSSGSGSGGAAASGSGSSGSASGSGSSGSASGGGLSVSTFPASGAQNVPTNTVITVSFSQPVTLGKTTTPVLSPDIGGKWVQSGPDKFSFQLHSPLIPDTRMQVTIPGGRSGIQGAQGGTLPRS
ncbi:MAG TPA: Ig-like domain-containing protein, partial [Acidimicrobiales bacterium]